MHGFAGKSNIFFIKTKKKKKKISYVLRTFSSNKIWFTEID